VSAPTPPTAFRHEAHGAVTSTNDLVRARAEAGEPEGLVISAEIQTAGRGRQGRSWDSPRGNLYASFLLRPRASLAEAASLSPLLALAVAEAIAEATAGRVQPRVKWPNDILVGRSKLAGILLEGEAAADGRARYLVAGIGANLVSHPPDGAFRSTSLAALGVGDVGPLDLLGVLTPAVARRYATWRATGFAGQRADWLARALAVGSEVTVRQGDDLRRGRFADLGEDGSILLENDAGCLERVTAGELFFA
jgi:BirA family biotin operon repressor/biotin-[acetyl-CoA-carboxylase] ligase